MKPASSGGFLQNAKRYKTLLFREKSIGMMTKFNQFHFEVKPCAIGDALFVFIFYLIIFLLFP